MAGRILLVEGAPRSATEAVLAAARRAGLEPLVARDLERPDVRAAILRLDDMIAEVDVAPPPRGSFRRRRRR